MAQKFTQFTKKEIDQLFKSARKVLHRPGIIILLAPRTKEIGRLLAVIPRKVGNAPVRNKLRRRLKAIFYQQSFTQKPFDVIVLAKQGAADYSFDDLKAFLIEAYEHADSTVK